MADDANTSATVAAAPPIVTELSDTNGGINSHFFSISLRGILAFLLTLTLCFLAIRYRNDKFLDSFVIIVSNALSFYFGQGQKKS